MNTIRTLGFTGAGLVAAVLLAPYISVAEMSPAASSGDVGSGSVVHRVSHSLAGAESYSSGGPSGYKWGRKVEQTPSSADWSASTTTRGGYKWGNSSASEPNTRNYAGTASYTWGVQGYADQTGYRWGLKNYADQTGYRWGLKNYADQTGYRWGLK